MTAVQAELDGLPKTPPVPASAPQPPKPEPVMPTGTYAILNALIAHYRKPGSDRSGEILITEAAAPGGSTRRADLVRIGMWASRGTGIDVHEIKISRSDWLRELDDPAKAEAWWPYCNRFWITAPPGIVRDGELPAGWGLMQPQARSRRFKVIVRAADKAPKLTLALLIELLRRADNERLGEMDAIRERHRADLDKIRREASQQKAVAEIPLDVKHDLELLKRLEKALGGRLSQYASWQGRDRITPEELAAVLGDAGDHVAVQRRRADAERVREHLLTAVRQFTTQLEREK
jgi:hypothetical protein